ncbi:MAG: aminotransferase class III-fold pyridoxal phosphate-dependent enzyme [Candidatus Dormibacteraeota bacterium]|nr:aminotransferase class III-fold pyridoxal phosphate-dependent enzyme [Candidatus Dormibacteraeota bacterium]
MPPQDRSSAPSTQDLINRARSVLPGGSTHAARSYDPPIYVVRASGSRKWLVDGREIIDYTMGHGALLLGHAHPAVVQAVQEQTARGTHYGAAHPLEVEWAELIRSLLPSCQEVRFTASGTEATMLALRIARTATGRDHVVKLQDHFHGWYDAVSVNLDDAGLPVQAAGVPAALAALTRVVRPGDTGGLRAAVAPGDAAAVILEGSGAHYGRDPLDPAFVAEIREACDRTGTLMVMDEVVTGFRVAPGGMQSLLGVRPDLSVLGKVMAGGLPGGAVGGRRDLLELLAGTVYHPGTWNANPLSASAGITTLRLVGDGIAQRTADGFARTLESEFDATFERTGIPGRVWRLASILHVALDDPAAHSRLPAAMRGEGVDFLNTSAFCSTVHSLADIEQTVDAFGRAVETAAR